MNEKQTGYGCSLAILIIALVPIVLMLFFPLVMLAGDHFHLHIDIPGVVFFFGVGVLVGILAMWIYRKIFPKPALPRGFEISSHPPGDKER
jgi:hypothetical protein